MIQFFWGIVAASMLLLHPLSPLSSLRTPSKYQTIEVQSMITGELVKTQIDPLIFVVRPSGNYSVKIHYKTTDSTGIGILTPMNQLINLRKMFIRKTQTLKNEH